VSVAVVCLQGRPTMPGACPIFIWLFVFFFITSKSCIIDIINIYYCILLSWYHWYYRNWKQYKKVLCTHLSTKNITLDFERYDECIDFSVMYVFLSLYSITWQNNALIQTSRGGFTMAKWISLVHYKGRN